MSFASQIKSKIFPVCALIDEEVARNKEIAQETVTAIKTNPTKVCTVFRGTHNDQNINRAAKV